MLYSYVRLIISNNNINNIYFCNINVIAQIIPSAVKGLSQQNIRSNNSVTLAQVYINFIIFIIYRI